MFCVQAERQRKSPMSRPARNSRGTSTDALKLPQDVAPNLETAEARHRGIEARLKIISLSNEIVEICASTPKLSDLVGALAKQFQLKLSLALSENSTSNNIELPTVAPEKWRDRKNRNETPPDFIYRVYAPYLNRGLTRAHIRSLDFQLYERLNTYISKGGQTPPDFALRLPTKRQVNDLKLSDFLSKSGATQMDDLDFLAMYHASKRRRRKS